MLIRLAKKIGHVIEECRVLLAVMIAPTIPAVLMFIMAIIYSVLSGKWARFEFDPIILAFLLLPIGFGYFTFFFLIFPLWRLFRRMVNNNLIALILAGYDGGFIACYWQGVHEVVILFMLGGVIIALAFGYLADIPWQIERSSHEKKMNSFHS